MLSKLPQNLVFVLLFDVLPNIVMMCKFVVDNTPPITSCIIFAVVAKHLGAALHVAPSVVVA
jgi:hypothetical protein